MHQVFQESTVFYICKSAIYLLLTGVLTLLIWAGGRLSTLDSYVEIHANEMVQLLESPSSLPSFTTPSLLSGGLQFSSLRLGQEWEDRLPFAERKQMEVFAATLKQSQQEELLKNFAEILEAPVLVGQEPASVLQSYLALKKERYTNPPEIWGLPARIVLPTILALGSLLLIFLFLCVVLLKVERNTR